MNKECVHYWIIEPASSTQSKGKCKKCNKVGYFENSLASERRSVWSLDSRTKYERKALIL